MKRAFIFTLLIVIISCIINNMSADELLLKMTSSDFSNWNYNRPGELLTQSLIVNNKVFIYNDRVDGNYTLSSSVQDLKNWKTIRVDFNWRSISYDQPEFSMVKNSPHVSILATDSTELSTSSYTIVTAKPSTDISLEITLDKDTKGFFQFSAPLADINSIGSINKIKIYGVTTSGIATTESENISIFYSDARLIVNNAASNYLRIVDLCSGQVLIQKLIKADCFTLDNLKSGLYAVVVGNITKKILVTD